MKTSFELVTPKRAKELLEKNICNRSVNERKVKEYSYFMECGKWGETHQGIAISKTNKLIDGQHRLLAIIKSGVSLMQNITTEVEDESFAKIDIGYNRTSGVMMDVAGVKNYNAHASGIAKMIVLVKRERPSGGGGGNKELFILGQDVIDEYYSHQEIYDEIHVISSHYYCKFRIISKSVLYAAIAYLHFTKKWELNFIYDFLKQLYKEKPTENNTLNVFFNALMKNLVSNKKYATPQSFAFFVKTWNAFVKKSELRIMKYDDSIEEYPVFLSNTSQKYTMIKPFELT